MLKKKLRRGDVLKFLFGLLEKRRDLVAFKVSPWTYRDICRYIGCPPYNDPSRPKMPTTYIMDRPFIIRKGLKKGDVFVMNQEDCDNHYNTSKD